MKKINQSALRRSMWGSLSRVIGVGLGVGAGGVIQHMVTGWAAAIFMGTLSFILIWFAEYEKEATGVQLSSSEPSSLKSGIALQLEGEPVSKSAKIIQQEIDELYETILHNQKNFGITIIIPNGTDINEQGHIELIEPCSNYKCKKS